ncbi:hypothetical protein M0813_30108 [Anaeramoeba flamelloides]|uniref:Uncharacterized protein n=1 Tax=Anaeramoeba flamelloides TaxID=1746091 RepID=A0ABQ8XL93_9EUKA|nr:hypothetical protein M0813_30108 [Anaeramoeba flamelloides]
MNNQKGENNSETLDFIQRYFKILVTISSNLGKEFFELPPNEKKLKSIVEKNQEIRISDELQLRELFEEFEKEIVRFEKERVQFVKEFIRENWLMINIDERYSRSQISEQMENTQSSTLNFELWKEIELSKLVHRFNLIKIELLKKVLHFLKSL